MANPGEGFPTLAEALDAAMAEAGEGNPADSDTADPAVEEALPEDIEQAEESAEEQPEADGEAEALEAEAEGVEDDEEESDEEDSLFDDLDLDEEDEAAEQPDLDSMTFELPNGEVVEGIQALKDGYLRQSDYTQKTQQLAEERKALEAQNKEAVQVYEALRNNPIGFFSSLAKQVGVDVDVQGAKNPDFKFPAKEDFEAEVEKRLQERLENDPEIREARNAAARVKVDNAFAALEQERDIQIGPKDRKRVLDFALKNDITNLDVAFDALMARAQAKKAKSSKKTERAKQTSTKRSTGRVPEKTVTTKPTSVKEAMQRAAAEMAAS